MEKEHTEVVEVGMCLGNETIRFQMQEIAMQLHMRCPMLERSECERLARLYMSSFESGISRKLARNRYRVFEREVDIAVTAACKK